MTVKTPNDNPLPQAEHEHVRTGTSPRALKAAFQDNLNLVVGRPLEISTAEDRYHAVALSVRDRIMQRWIKQVERWNGANLRQVSYLSAEFLMGPHLGKEMLNLGITEHARQAMTELGLDLDQFIGLEEEPGLGNGGLGRLAACYLDSLATVGYPAIGYGIRYEFGIFDQIIKDGWQVEVTDKWLRFGNVWEIARPHFAQVVKLGGNSEHYTDEHGADRIRWVPGRVVVGTPYDTPILGHGVETCALLRLWSAEAAQSFDFADFNRGDYYGAVHEKVYSENISKVLYPNDEQIQGKHLRLEQQYFFVACSIKDMIRLCLRRGLPIERFNEMYCIQLNDTHPAIAIAELMRQLVDKFALPWEQAWDITRKSFSYTNHTLLPEALEKWPLPLFSSVLPRHLEIIYEINHRFLDEIRIRYPGDEGKVERMSIIDESGEKYVRMANLAVIGSHAINGVAELHSELVKSQLFADFHEMAPERFHNVTNGVTPRRFIALSNPGLARLIDDKIGDGWLTDLDRLKGLETYANDTGFQQVWADVKRDNKIRLAKIIKHRTGIVVDPASLFDIQVKRIHEYKRQHLNVLNIISLYQRIKHDPKYVGTPRTFIFGGKAAPGYFMAKLIIKLINSVSEVINHDPQVRDMIKVVFLPDYNVKHAQNIYPAADLSEQISTAGKEASGTGNMKFSMNGALTIGTLDGANIEIREEVGEENFFLFGLTADQVASLKTDGYAPYDYYHGDMELKQAIDLINCGLFSHGDTRLFRPLTDHLLHHDEYLLMADYRPYVDCQQEVDHAYRDPAHWTHMSILNVARMGKFSSDRAIREYGKNIWNIEPLQ
ncbi:glycogen/starch/alpha-glucan phosphorylase [Candidatus Methylospira mobilis]|uniref:Alpha-1,4 glucan phosphorylase n=1 Tax=Candidatus Methylospira mobilis TaxID=1808979 RepID=A0A5Q0BGP9_9GAMM|nr:glycogen/starch/alpha-glucan phosphorylase [Candidatus Methylospira mobilis]QFY41298.1 glycogen/starch/alpha-glucan phosphorylase [Candidatus Methylospira mobilis]WNV05480.1 glycogen/starch/alpha-glucan phosphorylase [Candidatus Methylospira mobilis]